MTQEALIKARNQLKRAVQVIQSLCPQGYIHPVLGSIHGAIVDAQEALAEHAMRETQRLGQEIEQEPVAKYCCRLCFNKSGSLLLDRMILCSECGNKRCPKATNHKLQCTNSNEPNQAGSIYNTQPQRTEQEPVPTLEDLEQEIYQNTRNFVSRDVMEWMLRRYYTTPPQRTWVGLTEQDLDYLCNLAYTGDEEFALAVQAKLMEKNA